MTDMPMQDRVFLQDRFEQLQRELNDPDVEITLNDVEARLANLMKTLESIRRTRKAYPVEQS